MNMQQLFDLHGRTAIVTGGSRGLGQEMAEGLAEAGAARIVPDEEFDGKALLEAAQLLTDRAALDAMSAASRGIGRPGAADAVAELVLALAEGTKPPSQATIDRVSRAEA